MSETQYSGNDSIQVFNEETIIHEGQVFSEQIVAQMISKQSQLEERLKAMRVDVEKSFQLYRDMLELLDDYKIANDSRVENILERLEDAEEDIIKNNVILKQLVQTVEMLHTNIKTMTVSLQTMNTSLEVIKDNQEKASDKQDIVIGIQDKFIVNLWKAFFAILGVVTIGGSAMVALLK